MECDKAARPDYLTLQGCLEETKAPLLGVWDPEGWAGERQEETGAGLMG